MRDAHGWFGEDFNDQNFDPDNTPELDPWNPVRYQGDLLRKPSFEPVSAQSEAEGFATSYWDIEDLTDGAFFPDQWEDVSVQGAEWEEPDPTEDPNSTLGDPLYPTDDSITDISRELKIGELLALVTPCTMEQRNRCLELLRGCKTGRLRQLIPWLRKYDWCGYRLQLLLEFRNLWRRFESMHWWETIYWNHFSQTWMSYYSKDTLTLEYTRYLIEKRENCIVTDIIGRSWIAEWEDSAAWEHGIRSFANFAVLRASYPDGDQWREHLHRHDRRTELEILQCTDPCFAPFMLPSIIRQYSCPKTIDFNTDPWPDVTDMVHRRSAALGGNLDQAWEEIISRITDF